VDNLVLPSFFSISDKKQQQQQQQQQPFSWVYTLLVLLLTYSLASK
jgi:hypothetical protein